MQSRWRVGALVIGLVLGGCDREPVREWSPSDHDQSDNPGQNGQVAPVRPAANASGQAAAQAQAQAQLVDIAWSRQCATCHGPTGHGDGPSGPMVQAPDLTRPDWQAQVSDEQIAQVISQGKGKMPKLDLPAPVVAGLVRRVRSLRGAR